MENIRIIPRDYYLNQLISCRHNSFIKIITGIRRCGKSFLLFNLFHNYLIQNGVSPDHIIELSMEERESKAYQDPDRFLSHISGLIVNDGRMNYVIIDEIQLVEDFESVLLSLMHKQNVDVYVSGSNSKFLSKDIITEFRGRGYEIRVNPLSFAEYYSAVHGDKYERWREYCKYGGLPQTLSFSTDSLKENFLRQLQQTVYLRDLIERCRIKNRDDFQELYRIMASIIGTPCNPNKISNSFKSVKKKTIDSSTIANYLEYMEDAFLVERAIRYDIKGKKYINTLSKYYFTDIGLRNAVIGFRQIEESHIMENVIYNELRNRGYRVDVGFVEVWTTNEDKRQRKQLEVDFVAELGYNRYYIQSALEMASPEKKVQEKASLNHINDGFKRIIIVRSDMAPYYDENGYLIIGLYDFLLKPHIFNEL